MTPDERRAVDVACLRLLGYSIIEYDERGCIVRDASNVGRIYASPSRSPGSVVPLAEALRARGWDVEIRNGDGYGWIAEIGPPNDLSCRVQEFAATLPMALALAAARAVGDEP